MVIGLESLKLSGTALERRQKKEIERLREALFMVTVAKEIDEAHVTAKRALAERR